MTQEFKVGDKVQRKESMWTWQKADSYPQFPKGSVFKVSEYLEDEFYPSVKFEHTGYYQYDTGFFELVLERSSPPKYYVGTHLICNLDSAKVKADLKDNGWSEGYWRFLNGSCGIVSEVQMLDNYGCNYKVMVEGTADSFWMSQDEDTAVEYTPPIMGNRIKADTSEVTKQGPIKSDGGSSPYYDLEVPEWLIDNLVNRYEEGECYIKTEEMITAFFSNSFDYGNLLKCLVRVHGTQIGTGGKAGNSVDYECNKMNYSVEKIRGKK